VVCDMLSEVLRSLLGAAAEATDLHEEEEREGLTEVPAGAEDAQRDLSAEHSAVIFVPREGRRRRGRWSADCGRVAVIGGLSARDALLTVINGELAKHALSESTKSLVRYYSESSETEDEVGAMATRARLQVGRKRGEGEGWASEYSGGGMVGQRCSSY
jgi:hypothetical protein